MENAEFPPICEYCGKESIGRITPFMQPSYQHEACKECIDKMCPKGGYFIIKLYSEDKEGK